MKPTEVCPNCGQWKHDDRCMNDCQAKGLDPTVTWDACSSRTYEEAIAAADAADAYYVALAEWNDAAAAELEAIGRARAAEEEGDATGAAEHWNEAQGWREARRVARLQADALQTEAQRRDRRHADTLYRPLAGEGGRDRRAAHVAEKEGDE